MCVRLGATMSADAAGTAPSTISSIASPTWRRSRRSTNAARRTVSYKIKRLGAGRLPSRGAQAAAAPRRFGPASLSMVGAPQGSVTVQQNTYGCANTDSSNPTCWGVLYASGIQAGRLLVNVSFSDGSTQPYDYSGFIDGSGNVQNRPAYLQLPCTNNFNLGAMITSVQAKDAASGQSISSGTISPPFGCAGA